jgi:simple sugar transport system permease protein
MDGAGEFLAQALRIAVPYVLAAVGGALCERSGVVNLAIEGLMLTGACAAAIACDAAGGGAGVMAAAGAGLLLAGVLAAVTVGLGANQIVAGVALNLAAVGATRLMSSAAFGTTANSPRIAGLGAGAGAAVAAAAVVALAAHGVVARTRFGLRLRASGEHPEAAVSLGVSVRRVRVAAVLASGALAALAGASLAFDQGQWSDGMSAGRGYIAIAAMILGRWTPLGALLAGVFFGFAEATEIALQTSGLGLPGPLVQTIPYLCTIVAVSGAVAVRGGGSGRAPAALGRPLD